MQMASSNEEVESFVHQLAIKLSRVLNIVNPNDLLARRVIEIAKTNSLEDFIQGESRFLALMGLSN